MASHHDLLDAIVRVVAGTGGRDRWRSDLPGADLAANEGSAADAIRGAETALARQNSAVAHVDLEVVTAVLNAHAANTDGAVQLHGLKREIESAVMSRTDLDTPAGAREFQRFLITKLRDIRTVVDTAGLDATSKAALAAALASLYASTAPPPDEAETPQRTESQPAERLPDDEAGAVTERWSAEPLSEPLADAYQSGGSPELSPMTAANPTPMAQIPGSPAPMTAPASGMTSPGWGAGLPTFGGLTSPPSPEPDRSEPLPDRVLGGDRPDEPAAEDSPGDPQAEDPQAEDPQTVHLPDGGTVDAPSPEVAAAMTAALAGTPITEAFRQQGITLPAPGAAITAPVATTDVMPGDVGVLADRHALALGNGKALLDGQIQPIGSVIGLGFLGWQHPSVDEPTTQLPPTTQTPDAPAPLRPAQTAPS